MTLMGDFHFYLRLPLVISWVFSASIRCRFLQTSCFVCSFFRLIQSRSYEDTDFWKYCHVREIWQFASHAIGSTGAMDKHIACYNCLKQLTSVVLIEFSRWPLGIPLYFPLHSRNFLLIRIMMNKTFNKTSVWAEKTPENSWRWSQDWTR